ncbi:response regulator transcription factor [Paenibacillus sp. XY044]|uniref:response regulator transcription factor n=1 Tax=Paenibacillus sp. XY044 TaxID=2026089 RepID=UPI0015C5F7AC|nr:LuxR C-terminal-related transcriptional regulator [Paenibacillus sp. XY044]
MTKLCLTVASSADNDREREELAELHSFIMSQVVRMNIGDFVQLTLEYVTADQDHQPRAMDMAGPRPGERPEPAALSGRQLEIAELLCRHYSIRRIAEELYISVNTVKKHMQNIKKALCLEQAGGDFVYLLSERLKER